MGDPPIGARPQYRLGPSHAVPVDADGALVRILAPLAHWWRCCCTHRFHWRGPTSRRTRRGRGAAPAGRMPCDTARADRARRQRWWPTAYPTRTAPVNAPMLDQKGVW
jgi:hypothetical protein